MKCAWGSNNASTLDAVALPVVAHDVAVVKVWIMWPITTTKVALALAAATAVACVAVGVWSYRTGHERGAAAVQQKWDAERAAIAAAQAEELMKARQREKALTEALDKQRLERRREVDRITAEYRRAIDGMRERPDRQGDGGVSDPATAGTGPTANCTGAQLYRSDAEFLVGEAARADQLRVALQQCKAAYDEVRQALAKPYEAR